MTTCCDKHISGEQNGRIGITMIASVKILYYFHFRTNFEGLLPNWDGQKYYMSIYIYIQYRSWSHVSGSQGKIQTLRTSEPRYVLVPDICKNMGQLHWKRAHQKRLHFSNLPILPQVCGIHAWTNPAALHSYPKLDQCASWGSSAESNKGARKSRDGSAPRLNMAASPYEQPRPDACISEPRGAPQFDPWAKGWPQSARLQWQRSRNQSPVGRANAMRSGVWVWRAQPLLGISWL